MYTSAQHEYPTLGGFGDVPARPFAEPAKMETRDKMSDIEFHAVAKTGDLDEGEAMQVIVGRNEIAIYNLDGTFYATDDICTHAYASLADGYVEGELIECPLHGGCFDIRTGKAMTPPVTDDLKTYEIKIDGEEILVGVPADG